MVKNKYVHGYAERESERFKTAEKNWTFCYIFFKGAGIKKTI